MDETEVAQPEGQTLWMMPDVERHLRGRDRGSGQHRQRRNRDDQRRPAHDASGRLVVYPFADLQPAEARRKDHACLGDGDEDENEGKDAWRR